MGEAVRIHPYSVSGRWSAVKERFPDIRGHEVSHDAQIACVERQAAFVAARASSLIGDDIINAYAVVGLHIATEIDPDLHYRFTDFPEPVNDLVERCLSTLHPDHNPQLAAVAARAWAQPGIRVRHFTRWGSVLRRLIDSARFWTRRGLRAYIQSIVPLLEARGLDFRKDHIDFYCLVDVKLVDPS